MLNSVPLATLICASKPPPSAGKAILSPEGKKRFFVVHGGLFSKDGVTLEDIRKLDRIGKQPGTEGLMCEVSGAWIGVYGVVDSLLAIMDRRASTTWPRTKQARECLFAW